MDQHDLIEILDSDSLGEESRRRKLLQNMNKLLIDSLITKHLGLDQDSIEWFKGLCKVSVSELDGFKYICKEYNISNSKSSIYKAICTADHDSMEPLFRASSDLIPFELSKKISSIIDGKIEELNNLVINRIQIQNNLHKMRINFQNVHKINLDERMLENRQELQNYMQNLFNLIEGEGFNLKTLKKILKSLGINPDLAHILFGFNALLNSDYRVVDQIFDYQLFKEKIDNEALLDAVIKFVSGTWSNKTLEIILKNMILTHKFYENHDPELIVKELKHKVEFSMIKNIAKACEGNMVSCGKVLD